jgi:DNA repair protein RadC
MKLIREIKEKYIVNSKEDTLRYLREFQKEDREFLVVLGLDTENKVLYRDVVSIGTLNSSLIHPREVFKCAIMNSANSIIIAHNHPSGSLTPSEEDINAMRILKKAGELLQIKVLDSLIISPNGINSINEVL